MKRKSTTIVLIIIFIIGIITLFYPFVSQKWNAKVQSEVIENYDGILEEINEEDYDKMFQQANNYNKELSKLSFPLSMYKKLTGYNNILNINNKGVMGYIEIKKIKVELPIYHGIGSNVLNTSVGHMEGSSLPVGGNNTHSVLSAHSGLSTSKLFTNLNKLEVGDIFIINILNRKLTYQVDEIKIVEPNDVSGLNIIQDKDYVTLITCTPYGINTHRLLVRGSRIENIIEKKVIITSEADLINKLLVSLVIAIPILIILIIYIIVKPAKKESLRRVYV